MVDLIKAPVMLPTAGDALAIAAAFEAGTEGFYEYEILSVYNSRRQLVGYNARVKDLDGSFVGYLG